MVNKLFLEGNWKSFFIKPIILLHLVILLFICSLKPNLESNAKLNVSGYPLPGCLYC